MKRMILGLVLAGVSVQLLSQTITIYEKESNKVLELVTIQARDGSWDGISDQWGQCTLPKGNEDMVFVFRRMGFDALELSRRQISRQGLRVYLTPAGYDLDQVVISATRRTENRRHIPSRIQTIQQSAIALQNPQTAADLLGSGGEVFIQKSQQGGGSPMIRGFATNRLLYAVDGIRMNTAIFRSGNIQNVINLDPFALERAEVLFGPGSVIYGSDAIGGVMSFQTLKPRLSGSEDARISGKAVARYASANQERTAHLDVRTGWEKWALVTSLTSWQYDHLRQGRQGPDDYLKPFFVQTISGTDEVVGQEDPLLQIPSAYDQMNVMQKIRYRPNESWDFEYGFHFSETSPYGRYDRHNRLRGGRPRYAEWQYGPQRWMMNNLLINHQSDFVGYDQLHLRLAHQVFEESRMDRDWNDPERRNRQEQVEAWSVNLDMDKQFSEMFKLYYGLEFVRNEVRSSGEIEEVFTGERRLTSSRYPDASWQSLAGYFSGEYRPSSILTVQGGVRYNHFALDTDFSGNQEFFPLPFLEAQNQQGALTANIGGVYRPSERWTWRLNLGSAFRAPNVDDMGKIFDSEPGRVVVPNVDLDAETAYSADLGVAYAWPDKVEWELTAFYTYLNNALSRRDFTLNGQDSTLYDGVVSRVQAIQNAASAQVYGMQLRFLIHLGRGWTWTSHVNLQVGEEETDDGEISPSRHAAPVFGVSRLSYQTQRFDLQGYLQFQGARSFEELAIDERGKTEIYALDRDGRPYAPAWYTLNLKMRYQLDDQMTITGGVENITDRRYRPYSSGLSGAGRNFILALTLDW